MQPIKKVTHILAAGVAALGAFMLSPAGEALAKQYPHISALIASVLGIVALYRKPTQS